MQAPCKYVAEALVLNGVSTETCINDPKYYSSVKNDWIAAAAV